MSSSQTQRLRSRKQKNYGSMDTHLEIKDGESGDNTSSTQPQRGRDHKRRLDEVSNCGEFCEYLATDTCSKLSFIYLFLSIFIPFIIAFYYFALDEYRDAYIVSGIFGFVTCVYASNHFRTLFSLKKEIDDYSRYNATLQNERTKFNRQIDILSKGRRKLTETHDKLRLNNMRLCDMNQKFEAIEQQLSMMNAQNYDELNKFSDKAKHLKGKYYDISLQQQRNILFKIFDRLQIRGKQGLTATDYDAFHELLPKEHQERFDRLGGFDALLKMSDSEDKGYVEYDDFAQALDVYAKMQVENCDITFKIDRVPSKEEKEEDEPGRSYGQRVPKFMKNITILNRTNREGFYLTKEDVWMAALHEQEEEEEREPSQPSKSKIRSRSPSPSPLAHEPVLGRQNRINK